MASYKSFARFSHVRLTVQYIPCCGKINVSRILGRLAYQLMSVSGRQHVVVEAVPAGDNTDTSTQRTVAMMCDYIAQSVGDPVVQQAAAYCLNHFAAGRRDPGMLAWAVFWYVKHCVKLRQDEATLFRIGARDEFDLLIAPSVLVRMKNPAEDCDGFTMLCAALCSILGLPVFIATVAVSPDDPSRWSHVFPCSIVNGAILPLDASHGPGPGWMVPRSRIYRFQAWGLDGRPLDIGVARFQGLHNYVRQGRGFGDPSDTTDFTDGSLPTSADTGGDFIQPPATGGSLSCPAGTIAVGSNCFNPSNPNNAIVGSAPGSSPTSFNLTSFFSSLFGNAANVAAVATAQPTYRLPNGTVVTGVSPTAAAPLINSASITSALPLIGLGLLALVFVMKGKK